MLQSNFGFWWWSIFKRVFNMTKWRWPYEFDRTMTTTNLNNWTWPKLKLTKLLKPRLATLLEGAGYFFNISKVNSQTFILLRWKKCGMHSIKLCILLQFRYIKMCHIKCFPVNSLSLFFRENTLRLPWIQIENHLGIIFIIRMW